MFTLTRVQYPMSYYFHLFNSGDITTPKYQREHCWKPEFEVKLILSVLKRVDVPKIYLGNISETGEKHLIDGGHRSRTFQKYMMNEFPVLIDGVYTYYNKDFEQETKGKRNLTEEEKRDFDNYHLDVITYQDITEKDCRNIFNDLQNARPMSIEDVINSWQSDLVEYIRDLLDESMRIDEEEKTVREWFENYPKIMGNNKTEKTKIMCQLISWFTIIFPQMDNQILNPKINEEEEVSLTFLTKGNNNNSPCLNYVKEYTDDITEEIKATFMNNLTFIFDYYINHEISPSDLYTLIHSRTNYDSFDINDYEEILQNVKDYDTMRKDADKLWKEKKFDLATEKSKEAEDLNDQWDKDLEKWFKSRKDGGNNPSGMRKRQNIVIERCV